MKSTWYVVLNRPGERMSLPLLGVRVKASSAKLAIRRARRLRPDLVPGGAERSGLRHMTGCGPRSPKLGR